MHALCGESVSPNGLALFLFALMRSEQFAADADKDEVIICTTL